MSLRPTLLSGLFYLSLFACRSQVCWFGCSCQKLHRCVRLQPAPEAGNNNPHPQLLTHSPSSEYHQQLISKHLSDLPPRIYPALTKLRWRTVNPSHTIHFSSRKI